MHKIKHIIVKAGVCLAQKNLGKKYQGFLFQGSLIKD
jgi:hypothetical protein